MAEEKFSTSLQENLLTLICFSDDWSSTIRGAVESSLFQSSVYRVMVEAAYGYIDQFKKPPKDHMPDLLEEYLQKGDKTAELYHQILGAVFTLKENINASFVMMKLTSFVRQQRMKIGIVKASDLITEGNLEQAEVELEAALRQRLQLFAPGMTLAEGVVAIRAGKVREGYINIGIKELDEAKLGPAKKEIQLFMAPPKRGKSWWLVNLAKQALMQRQKVVYITLEISEGQITQRILQSLFSMTQTKTKPMITSFERDDLGRLLGFKKEQITGRPSVEEGGASYAQKMLAKLHFRDNLLVKEFPTGMLTVSGVIAYLDALDRISRFVPDLLIIDYPDLMKIDVNNYRLDLGVIMKQLRGVAVERNLGLATVRQANRVGTGAKLLLDIHASEAFSTIADADTVITYSQTREEKALGLARLHASNTRVGDRDGFVVLISQSYPTGQFVMDSLPMSDKYWQYVGASNEDEPMKKEEAE